MGIAKLVSIEDLMNGNPRMCLSANRVFNSCHLCPKYEGCESRIENPEAQKQLEEKEKLEEQLKDIKKKIKEISI